jgi:flagellin-like protein
LNPKNGEDLMKKITKIKRSVRAISPVISVLLMIAIAVAAALVAYAWVTGYMDFTTTKVGKSIQIQSISTTAVYVQNVGDSKVTLKSCYINGDLDDAATTQINGVELNKSETQTIDSFTNTAAFSGEQITVRIVTTDGTAAEYTETFSGATSGGSTPTPTVYLNENFDRADNPTVGNGWEETDDDPSAEAQILTNRLNFVSSDDDHQPLVYYTFSQVSTGKIKWTFTFNFELIGGEGTYEAFMLLGEDLTSAPVGETADVAVNLMWAGTGGARGMDDTEGFGYYDGTTNQVVVVSGESTIEVIADLDANTFDLTITGGGAGGSATSIPFVNDVNINTVMIYLNELNSAHFFNLEIDNVQIVEMLP